MAAMPIFIGYRTRPVKDVERFVPKFITPSNYKDEKVIADWHEKQKAMFIENAKNQPHTGTLDCVAIGGPGYEKYIELKHSDDPAAKPLCLRVRAHIVDRYERAWSVGLDHKPSEVRARIFAFDPRTFLKIVGLECSMPAIGQRCPAGLWYANSDHCDIATALIPKESKLDLVEVVNSRRPVREESAKLWDAFARGWKGPGFDPTADAKLAAELAAQLGFLDQPTENS